MSPFRNSAMAAAVAAVIALPVHAEEACEPFPDVSWWGKLTHQRVIRYVDRKHKGNWAAYLRKWERQLDKIEDVQRRDSRIIIRKRGLVVGGKDLDEYVDKVRVRIDVSRCLARRATESASFEPQPARERS
jgi:hypothetical protein